MDVSVALQVLWMARQWRQRDRWTRGQLEAYQGHSLRLLREYAYAHSSFYRQFHQGLTDRPLQELPVLTKALMMEHFDELVTDHDVRLADVDAHLANLRGDERLLGRYRVCATSGTTGRRGLFLFSRAEWVAVLAGFARAHDYTGLLVGVTHRMKMAEVASTTPWHMSARAGATLRSWWVPTLRLDATEPVSALVGKLSRFQPEMLVAYPSAVRILAEEQLAGRLCISPRLVFTSAEVLTEETRRLAEQVWGRVLFNQYSATESGILAAECEAHKGMHLLEDQVIVEVVDEDNRPVQPGVYGHKLLITVLFGCTQPLIRYELSDSIRLVADLCPCGRPFTLIEGIQGRNEEALNLPNLARKMIAVQPNLFHRVLDVVPAGEWQVVQEPDGLVVLLSDVRSDFSDETLADSLRRELEALGVVVPPVLIRRVETIPRGATGKSLLIRSNLSPS